MLHITGDTAADEGCGVWCLLELFIEFPLFVANLPCEQFLWNPRKRFFSKPGQKGLAKLY
jgi:hypothetical protein